MQPQKDQVPLEMRLIHRKKDTSQKEKEIFIFVSYFCISVSLSRKGLKPVMEINII